MIRLREKEINSFAEHPFEREEQKRFNYALGGLLYFKRFWSICTDGRQHYKENEVDIIH